MIARIMKWLFWLVLGGFGVALIFRGGNADLDAPWEWLWAPLDMVLGLVLFISAADHLGLFWRPSRCECTPEKTQFPSPAGYPGAWRDRALASIMNWIFGTFATRGYLAFITEMLNLDRTVLEQKIRDGEYSNGDA